MQRNSLTLTEVRIFRYRAWMAQKTKTAPAKLAKPRAAETPHEPPSFQVSIRLPLELVERLDRYQDRMQAEHPALGIKRADVVRVLLTRALDEAEGVKR